MFWIAARQVYVECKRLGLCRSQRDFSRRLLVRGPHYLRLVSNRQAFVSEKTTRVLRRRLTELAPTAAIGTLRQVASILADIDRAETMAQWLRRRA